MDDQERFHKIGKDGKEFVGADFEKTGVLYEEPEGNRKERRAYL